MANTPQALIQAALHCFGEYGLKGASTRLIAKTADVNLAAIPYHFGNKAGLYLATIDYISDQIGGHFHPLGQQISQQLQSGMDQTAALDALKKIISKLTELFIQSDEPKAWAQVIIREQAQPTAAFEHLYQKQIYPIQHMIAQLIAIYTGLDAESDEVKIHTHALISQVLGFLVSRQSILHHLNVKAFSPDQQQQIKEILITHTELMLKGVK